MASLNIHKDHWEPTIGKSLSCEQVIGNSHGPFAVVAIEIALKQLETYTDKLCTLPQLPRVEITLLIFCCI